MGVTHEMECHVIAALRKLNFTVIVSPYEADAQLAYLCHIGYCDAVLSEDSDILVYSAVSGHPFNVLYKFEKSGAVQVINLGSAAVGLLDVDDGAALLIGQGQAVVAAAAAGAGGSAGSGKEKVEKGFLAALKGFRTDRDGQARRMFVQTCILSGCDYCESVSGVGIMTAQQAVLKFKDCPDDERLQRICDHFKASGKVTSTLHYYPHNTLPPCLTRDYY
jgi:exonuclease-1